MAERNSTIRQAAGALAQRLLLVALFVFGFGEARSGSENVTARTALETHRAIQLSASSEPAPHEVAAMAASADGSAAVPAGGGDQHAAIVPAQPVPDCAAAPAGAGRHAPPVRRCHWFSSRAPPARA